MTFDSFKVSSRWCFKKIEVCIHPLLKCFGDDRHLTLLKYITEPGHGVSCCFFRYRSLKTGLHHLVWGYITGFWRYFHIEKHISKAHHHRKEHFRKTFCLWSITWSVGDKSGRSYVAPLASCSEDHFRILE